MGLARIGLAEERDAFLLGRRNYHILVAMDFLLAAVVQSLFFSLFWALATSFGAIDDGIRCVFPIFLLLFELLRVSFRCKPKVVQGLFQDRQQRVNPLIGLRLAHPKQLAHDRLQRVAFLIDQGKQQFLFQAGQRAFATGTNLPFSSLACLRLGLRILFQVDLFKGRQEQFKFFWRQTGKGDKFPGVRFEFIVC